MPTFSARFVVLACLCVAFPLSPPVEGAHIHGGHLMEQHTTSPHHPHQTHKPSFFDGSHKHDEKQGEKHDEKHDDHQTHHHRSIGLPPLLRRYRGLGHVHDQSWDSHDNHDDIPRSAFARSRYRRDSHSRGPSVYVTGEHGDTYMVSRTQSKHGKLGHMSPGKHTPDRRQVDGDNLAFGRIDIMGAAQSPGGTQRLASLTVDSTPIDWSSGQSPTKAFSLNASTTNQTQFIMVPTDESDTEGNSSKRVRLATQVFDSGSANMVMYCATYNANPGTPSALLMTPCDGTAQRASSDDATDSCADDKHDGSSSNAHQSQVFSYDPSSGAVEPIPASDGFSGGDSVSDSSVPCSGAKARRDAANATTSSSTTPSSTSASTIPKPSTSQQAQNVTLVYVVAALEVPAQAASPSMNTSTTPTSSAHINQMAMLTTTVTTTVVSTVASSGVTPAVAVASAPTPSLSLPIPTTRTSQIPLNTVSSGPAMATSAKAAESLEVEVVGETPSTTASSPSASVSAASAATTAKSLASTSTSTSTFYSSAPSLNAEAVASLVVAEMPHRRRAIAETSASVD